MQKLHIKFRFRCMLIVALGWSSLEAILESKTEHIVENCRHRASAIDKTFIKMYIRTFGVGCRGEGAQYLSSKNKIIWALISVLDGQCTLEWQFTYNYCLLEDLGRVNTKDEVLFPSAGRDLRGSELMSLCCSPTAGRMMHFSLTGLLEWENMKLTAAETYET